MFCVIDRNEMVFVIEGLSIQSMYLSLYNNLASLTFYRVKRMDRNHKIKFCDEKV